MNLQTISEQILGSVSWKDSVNGFLECPGKHLHTGHNSARDCKIYLNGAPTIHCFHQSCYGILEEVNLKLRRAIGGQTFEKRIITDKEREEIKASVEKAKLIDSLKLFSKDVFANIQENFKCTVEQVQTASPIKIPTDCQRHFGMFLNLFDRDDLIWIGDVKDSGEKIHMSHFKTPMEWLACPNIGNFTCGSTFRGASFSRSNEQVKKRKFLVVESDVLSKEEICSVFKFCKRITRLRAIVDTGGKSCHGWFDMPCDPVVNALKILLPEMGCDRALFKASQPVRTPGVMRGDKYQKLIYLDI